MLCKFQMRVDIWSLSLDSYVSFMLFSCTTEIWFLLVLKYTYRWGYCFPPPPFFFIPLRLFMCLFSGYIRSYWFFPLGVPVLRCESQKGSRDGLLLFGTYSLFFNTFFLECLPCDSIQNSPASSWKTISYFLAFLCQCYPGLWLMLTTVIICDFPPKLSIPLRPQNSVLQSAAIMSIIYETAGRGNWG